MMNYIFDKFAYFTEWAFDHDSFFVVVSAGILYTLAVMLYLVLCINVGMMSHWTVGSALFLSGPSLYLYFKYKEEHKDED